MEDAMDVEDTTGAGTIKVVVMARFYPRSLDNAFLSHDEAYALGPDFWDYKANNDIIFGPLYRQTYNNFMYEDAQRFTSDLFKNTGQAWFNSLYPYMAYDKSELGRTSTGSVDAFEATQSVVNMWSRKLLKW